MVIGMFLAVLSFVAAAFLQIRIDVSSVPFLDTYKLFFVLKLLVYCDAFIPINQSDHIVPSRNQKESIRTPQQPELAKTMPHIQSSQIKMFRSFIRFCL